MNIGFIKEAIVFTKELYYNRGKDFKLFNANADKGYYEHWFYLFLKARKIEFCDRKISFFSTVCPRIKMKLISGKKIFYSGENLERFERYSDRCLNDVNLSIGHDYIDHTNYVRIPFWVLSFIKPEITYSEIQTLFHNRINLTSTDRSRFAAMIARHDVNGIRQKMVDAVAKIDHVEAAGHFMNNTSELIDVYHNKHLKYLQNFYFNICPENSNADGYVTEKLFNAILAGCIPIYNGSNNKPDPFVFNSNAIIFFDEYDPSEMDEKLRYLWSNKRALKAFLDQPRFMPTAADYTWNMLNTLEGKLRSILNG